MTAPKFIVLYSGNIVSTYILTDARNALLFLAFTRMSYSMPSGENKESKAYSRSIFFNLRPNQIARILEHLQKGTFPPTRGASVYKQHNLSNFLQKEVPMGSETCLKKRRMMFFDFQGQKVLLKAVFEGTPGLLAQAGSIFWIRTLAASSLSTYGSDTGSE